MKLVRLVAAFAASPWALELSTLEALSDILARAQRGERLSDFEIEAAIGAKASPARTTPAVAAGQRQSVAVIGVRGVISHRASMVADVSSGAGTSTELLDQAIRAASLDPSIRSIVLDIDSPGGSVFGVQELAATIMEARTQKPIAAVANATAASAAYWIASAAHELFVTPSGEVGSIGVFGAHVDTSKADEAAGKKTTVISAGKYKAEGAGPLTDEAKAHMQSRVDAYYSRFVRDVARQRNVSVDRVRNGYGEGRTVGAQEALAAGMVDGIATLDQVIEKYAHRQLDTANKPRAISPVSALADSGNRSVAIAQARIALARAADPSP